MAHSLQHRQAAQFIGLLSSACTGKHRSDGPKADNALTFKPDNQWGHTNIMQGVVDAAARALTKMGVQDASPPEKALEERKRLSSV